MPDYRFPLMVVVLFGLCLGPARADFDTGFTAYEKNDYATALKEWLPAAEKGDPHAQHMLGFLYAQGRGVAIDPAKTVSWWQKAARQGFAPAQYTLGSLYRRGLGVKRDLEKARTWISRAADAGYPDAQHAFGVMHVTGEGLKPDLSAAFMWLDLAADTRGLPSGTFWPDVDGYLTPTQRLEADQLKKNWNQ